MPLDDFKIYKKYDTHQIGASNELLPQQVNVAWNETREIVLPAPYKKITNIVFVGMGGSALGAHMIKTVFKDRLKVPFEIVRDYSLPKYVSQKTLVVLSSFSGNTEEVLSSAKDAKKRKAKILGITTGGKLASFLNRNKFPAYIFNPGELAPQPRMGVGFSFIGVIGLLQKVGVLKVTHAEVDALKQAMNDVVDNSALDIVTKKNPAKIIAEGMHGRSILIISAEHLAGSAHVMSNQINESSKQFSIHMELPELNHHFLEGLTFPKKNFENFVVIMLRSALYNKRIQKRFDITADIFEELGGTVIDYNAGGDTKIEECGEILQFGSFVSFYLAMLSKIDPYDIPWVDKLKKKMAK